MRIGSIRNALFMALAALCLLPMAAQAQSVFTGVVKDTSGAVLPGVMVEAASDALIEKTRSVITDADGGYRLSKEAIILYGMRQVGELGARGIRINCTGPGVTETPILDQLRSAYGQDYLDSFSNPLGRVAGPDEQAEVLVYLGSGAASYITGQVIWVDGGTVAQRIAGDLVDTSQEG